MIIQASAGRRASIEKDGVEKLTLSQAKGHEAKMLYLLYCELRDGNLDFWAILMWAMWQGRVSKRTEQAITKVLDRLTPEFREAMGE